MTPTGLRQPTQTPKETGLESSAGYTGGYIADANLQRLVDAWPTLDDETRRVIVELLN